MSGSFFAVQSSEIMCGIMYYKLNEKIKKVYKYFVRVLT